MRTAAAAAILLLLTACTSSSGARPQPSRSRSLPGPVPPGTPAPTGTPSVPDGKGAKIGVILPDHSARWSHGEQTALRDACTAARLDCVIENAGGSPAEMASLAANMQTAGVRILVLVPIDAHFAGAIERTARRAGVLTVEYDQHVMHGSAAALVRPDTSDTGRLLARGLIRARRSRTARCRTSASMRRSAGSAARRRAPPTGACCARRPVGRSPRRRRRGRPDRARSGGTDPAQLLRSARGPGHQRQHRVRRHHGAHRAAAGRVGVAVSGNGATVLGLQHVLAGTQCFTIYHPPAVGAQALAATLVQLVNFQPVVGHHTVPAAKGRRTPVVEYGGGQIIKKADVKSVIDAGFADRAAVCTIAYAADCAAAGV